jgi:hypothetical protein
MQALILNFPNGKKFNKSEIDFLSQGKTEETDKLLLTFILIDRFNLLSHVEVFNLKIYLLDFKSVEESMFH